MEEITIDKSTIIDKDIAMKNAKQYLKEYSNWSLQYFRIFNKKVEDDIPRKGNSKYENLVIKECYSRINALKNLASFGTSYELLADLLIFRYIDKCTVYQVCVKLDNKYKKGCMSERTYNNYLHKALLTFAIICRFVNIN